MKLTKVKLVDIFKIASAAKHFAPGNQTEAVAADMAGTIVELIEVLVPLQEAAKALADDVEETNVYQGDSESEPAKTYHYDELKAVRDALEKGKIK